MTIKITLIDDHTLFRSGIKALLSRQPDFEVVGEASDGLVGVKMVEQLKPDVVLLDLRYWPIRARGIGSNFKYQSAADRHHADCFRR